MKFCSCLLLMGAVATFAGPLAVQSTAEESLKIGVAEADITPPEGFPMAGYYHERLATGIRDPLKAKAIVFRDGERAAAWVVADLTGISRDLCIEVRRQAAAKTGIPTEHIVVSATHSHTAPDYSRHLYDYLAQPAAKSGEQSYPAKLIGAIVQAIEQANAAAQPASIAAGSARQEKPVSFNRRFVMKDGSVRTWQRLDNPEVVRAAGPIDPEIGLVAIRSAESDKPLGVVSSFALHLDTVGGTLWSGDYPYFVEQALRKQLGPELVSLFGAGTCGDINHSDPVAKERNTTEVIGNALAATIVPALGELKAVENPQFQVRTTTVKLPLEAVTDEQLVRAEQLIPVAKAGGKVEFFDLVPAYKAVMLDHFQHKPPLIKSTDYISWGLSHAWAGVGPALPVEVTTMTLGDDVAIVFLPGEVFVDLGLAIKRGSPYPTTLVVELSNCVETIYIPTRGAYAGGGYEVANSAVQPGSGEMLVEAALRLLRESATQDDAAVWSLDRLDSIGGQRPTVAGAPQIVETEAGKALAFDGVDDALFLDANPLAGLEQFSVEVVFQPRANGPKEQRFLHFQETGSESRLLFETRLTGDGRWFLDTFLKTPTGDHTLFAEKSLHPIGPWYHAAVVMDGKSMRHYVNGIEELQTDVDFQPQTAGQTSIGVRLNKVFWYAGAIRQIKIWPRALAASELQKP